MVKNPDYVKTQPEMCTRNEEEETKNMKDMEKKSDWKWAAAAAAMAATVKTKSRWRNISWRITHSARETPSAKPQWHIIQTHRKYVSNLESGLSKQYSHLWAIQVYSIVLFERYARTYKNGRLVLSPLQNIVCFVCSVDSIFLSLANSLSTTLVSIILAVCLCLLLVSFTCLMWSCLLLPLWRFFSNRFISIFLIFSKQDLS